MCTEFFRFANPAVKDEVHHFGPGHIIFDFNCPGGPVITLSIAGIDPKDNAQIAAIEAKAVDCVNSLCDPGG